MGCVSTEISSVGPQSGWPRQGALLVGLLEHMCHVDGRQRTWCLSGPVWERSVCLHSAALAAAEKSTHMQRQNTKERDQGKEWQLRVCVSVCQQGAEGALTPSQIFRN